MSCLQNVRIVALALAILTALGVETKAQSGRPPMREHTVTKAQSVNLNPTNKTIRGSEVDHTVKGKTRIIQTNGLPNHSVGSFPNRGNPHGIKAQRRVYRMALQPKVQRTTELALAQLFGVALNGVPFDPGAAEFWRGNPGSGWQYEALGGAVPLGFDANYAHVQPDGSYHYHGLPVGLMQNLGWSSSAPSPLIGFAADGFPIYALTAKKNGKVVRVTSSYRLKSGNRPGGNQPGGLYDGAFVQDWSYVKGAGSLDECNGAHVKTKDFPQGTYAYFLTEGFPVIPRCLKAKPDSSFNNRQRRG